MRRGAGGRSSGRLAAVIVAAMSLGTACGGSGSDAPASNDRVTQTYWYCWDDGHGGPHHLGYRLAGDHLCSNGELRAAGFK
jgi:hypothetical protein